MGNIRPASLSRDARPADGPDDFSPTRGREPAVHPDRVRVPFSHTPSTNTHRSGLFRRARWCRQHTLPISRRPQRLPVHSRRRVRGRLPSPTRARTRRGCHHREHPLHSPNPPLIPCSVRNSTPRAVVVPETYPDLVPVPEVRDWCILPDVVAPGTSLPGLVSSRRSLT